MTDSDAGDINDAPNDGSDAQYQQRIARLRDLADKLERIDRQTTVDDVRINLYEGGDELTLVFDRGDVE